MFLKPIIQHFIMTMAWLFLFLIHLFDAFDHESTASINIHTFRFTENWGRQIYRQLTSWNTFAFHLPKINKPIWVEEKKLVTHEHKVPDWKQIWVSFIDNCTNDERIRAHAFWTFQVPDWVKMGIPGEKFLGKDKEGWEYTSHDLWRKKMIWKPEWKKIWRIEKKEEWVNILTVTNTNANFK